jgi:hypothetical protein
LSFDERRVRVAERLAVLSSRLDHRRSTRARPAGSTTPRSWRICRCLIPEC